MAARLASRVLAAAKTDEGLAEVLRRTTIEILPLLNPDGLYALLHQFPVPPRHHERTWRLTRNAVDQDRDGIEDEDGPRDLDGDAVIATMRVRDAAGGWRVSDEDPRLMVKAKPGEAGGWRVLTEGLDEDDDGRFNEDGPGGVDLDRNFAHGWREHDPEAGPVSPSEPESRALIEYVLANRSIACVLVLGHRDNLSKTPDANRAKHRVAFDGPHGDDRPWWEAVSKAHHEIVGKGHENDDRADGAFHQWAYYQYGVPAFASRVWYREDPEDPPPLPSGEKPTTEDGRWLEWSDRVLEGKGFLPWKAFEHPQLGAVEIGGFRPGVRTNPPAALLESLTDRQVRFVKDLLGRLPRIALRDVKAKTLAEGAIEVTATLVSEGDFPVITAMGSHARSVMPVRVTIDVAPGAILQGRALEKIDRLGRRGDHRKLRWVIRGKAGKTIRIRAVAEKAGVATAEVTP